MSLLSIQWIVVISTLLVLFAVSPWAKTGADFFKGRSVNVKKPNTFILTSGLVIAWIFAKSIANASDFGFNFGLLGGIGYAAFYLSFLVVGFVIYNLRTKGSWNSIHEFLNGKFGKTATRVFSFLIAIRLFNEVWSNTMVIGGFFGEAGSSTYYLAIFVFTALTLAYVLKGGLKTSLFTDVIQMMLFAVFLILILGFITPGLVSKPLDQNFLGRWDFAHGLDFLCVALVQSLSYGFHDPVMTDRGFISDPKTTRRSFILAAFFGSLCIILFSLVGVYMRTSSLESQTLPALAASFGTVAFIVMNLIMIISATSTLDSTFSSFSKLWIIDVFGSKVLTIKKGRMAMLLSAAIGTIPVFLGAEIIQATTISGTMVLGLAPIFILWKLKVPISSFYLSIGTGVFCGLAVIFHWVPENWFWTTGKYADLLFINVVGLLLAFFLYLFPFFIQQISATRKHGR